jgi:hypothetical protein
VRLALKVVMQNDGDFVDVILLHLLHTSPSRATGIGILRSAPRLLTGSKTSLKPKRVFPVFPLLNYSYQRLNVRRSRSNVLRLI